MSKSQYKPSTFEELHVTTMSGLTYFNEKVDYQRLFKYLPIDSGKFFIVKKGSVKKTKGSSSSEGSTKKTNVSSSSEENSEDIKTVKTLIFPEIPGKILTGKCMIDNVTYYSGIIKRYTKAFRNSTTIDISTSDKIVNAKIFVTCIHFCGLKNPTMFKEASKLIVDMMKKVQKISDNAEKNKKMTKRTIIWVKKNVSEQKIAVKTKTDCLKISDKYLNSDYPDDISVELADHFKKMIYIRNPKLYHGYLDEYLSFKRICSPDFAVKELNTSMLNYSFDLKFRPKLAVIALKFWNNHYSENYMVNYDNRIHSNLTIVKLYPLKSQDDDIEPEYAQVTFRIKKRGKATVSGPYEDICKMAYNEFMIIITSYYSEIHVKDHE